MSISVSVGVMIPTNVVEVGNEISADQLAALGAASAPSVANAYATNAFVTGQGYITSAPPAQPLLRPLTFSSQPLDEADNYYTFVIENSVTLTINDDSVNNPPIGSVFTILFNGNGQVSVDSGVTLNGGTASYGQGSICTRLLIKTAANTWYIG